MRMSLFVALSLVLVNPALCQYHPVGLRKLNDDERVEYVKKGIFTTEKTVYKDSLGVEFTDPNSLSLNLFLDFYVDDQGEIVECVSRKKTSEDIVLRKRIIDTAQEKDWGTVELLKLNCKESSSMLEDVFNQDQANRKSGGPLNMDIERKNLAIVLSIIEYCGFPEKKVVGDTGMTAVFLVFQHSTRKVREKYLPKIMECAKNGDLSMSEVALMEDRLLMENGEKQKFGTQIVKDRKKGIWIVYPIEDPKHVNIRRASIGLQPIEKYLEQWKIIFDPLAN